ncbi:MAG: amino acid adenylation domain-containing protein [Acidobacteriota bacterium]
MRALILDRLGELSPAARSARFRDMAERALQAYGLSGARLTLLEEKNNVTFRVDSPEGKRYLLRLCRPGGYDRAEIASEAAWLLALGSDGGIEAQEPVADSGGSHVVRVEVEDLEPRYALLLRWVPGERLDVALNPAALERVGELVARLHLFADRFVPPAGFSRPRYDCERMFGGDEVLPAGCGEPLVSQHGRSLLNEAAVLVRREIEALGTGAGIFGMIHTDPEPDNIVYRDGEVYPIDFADCGWGYYLYDVAAALLPLVEKREFPALREALLRGYGRLRPLPPGAAALLDTFLIARGLFAVRWMLVHGWDSPRVREYAATVVPHILGEVRRFLEARSDARLTTVQFLSHLRSLGVQLAAEGDRLRLRAPKGALTPELQAELAERKAEVLAFLQRGAAVAAAPSIPRAERSPGAGVPVSFSQRQLWFLDQFDPGNPAYNIPQSVHLEGEVRLDLLERSLNEVVRRQEVLRTTFSSEDGQPVQVIAPSLSLMMPVIDLRPLSGESREAEVRRLIREESRTPFDLAVGPLLRLTAIRLGTAEHRILVTMHHIISDGWSGGVFVRELAAIYAAFAEGRPSPLPELPIQFADYAIWQRQWLQGDMLERQLAYWREALAGAPAVLELPSDRPRTRLPTTRGGRQDLVVPAALLERIKSLGQEGGATLFMALLAALDALIFRYTGREDVVVGSPIANRGRTETEGLIGFFVNTLVLRTAFSGDESFRALLRRVRDTTVGAYAHQDLPFEKLVEELRPERNLSHTPLFQVVLNFQNAPLPALRLHGLTLTWMSAPTGTEKFDLNVAAREAPEGLLLVLRYKSDLFDAPTVGRLAGHLRNLLEAVAAGPDTELAGLSLLSEAEREQLLVEWNTGGLVAPGEPWEAFHERFARQAARTPDAPAVVFSGVVLTYGELNLRANRLAHHLRALGAGPGTFVGLCLERSVEMVVAIFAALKSGAAYVPLDPEYPPERLAFLVSDAGVELLVTRERWMEILPVDRVRAVRLDRDAGKIAARRDDDPEAAVGAADLAYVIYTSGTTGEPKGAMISHGAMAAYARAFHAVVYAHATGPLRASLNARIAFDASVKQLSHLLRGDSLEIVSDAVRLDADALVAFARERLDVLDCSPSQLKLLLKSGLPLDGSGPSIVLVGGEAIEESTWRVLAAAPGTRFFNHYGPTECTVNTTICRVAGERPYLGHTIPGMRAYVLDARLNPVPVGVPGEVCIGGTGVGRGYLARPRQTAERFIPDPFGGEPGSRLYRSGDLARRLPGGELEFLGRIDHQVKVRGFRIELGEIEAALRSHPAVREAVVLLRNDGEGGDGGDGDRRLVAYVVPRVEETAGTQELRGFLRAKLPDYMVPAAFVLLESLPLTANGKVDRRALPAPSRARSADEGGYEAPSTPTEELLAGFWAEILGLDRVGRDDNFFELGGHSLLATRVVSRIREEIRVDLPLRRLFEAPTVSGLAEALEEVRLEERGLAAPPLVPVPREADLPLSFSQQRLWFLQQLEPCSAAYNVPSAVRLSGDLSAERMERALRELSERHETLRTTFTAAGRPRQVIAARSDLRLPRVDLQALPTDRREGEARRLLRAEAGSPFDLESGPLLRATLLRLRERDHIALLTMHHIISDAWSMGVFVRELATLQEAFSQGEPSPLAPLPLQYADYAAWQRRWLSGDVLETALAYWRGQLAGAPEGIDLPLDRARPLRQASRGRRRRLALAPAVGEALAALSRREGTTLFMTLLAAFDVLLARVAGRDDIVVGTPIAGRTRREIEGLIGFFVNTLVLRTDLSGEPGFRELLARVRHTALEAYAHQDLPFDRLVEEIAPERNAGRSPLFQVMFSLQNAPREALELPGLTLAPLSAEAGTAKFDLTVVLQEGEDGIAGTFEYDAGLFDDPTMARLVQAFERLLAGAAEDPDGRIMDLPLLGAEQRQQILVEWNAAATRFPRRSSLPELFAAVARERPGTVAVEFGGTRMTYAELELRSGQLARRLAALGVGPEVPVGLCVERSADLVIGMLAILKAGGFYVPLDPSYPEERLSFMIGETELGVIVVQDALAELLPPHGAALLGVDPGSEEIPGESFAGAAGADAEGLAYVMYTSGSTGRPKGVAVTHRAIARLILETDYVRLGPESRVAQAANASFDAATFEIWGPLLTGGCVVGVSREVSLSPRRFADWLRENAVTTLFLTTALFDQVSREAPGAFSVLEDLLFGGEAVDPGRVREVLADGPRRLLHVYGPTESTTFATWHEVRQVPEGAVTVPIGRPLANTTLYLLDRGGQPVPAGVPGELCIGGDGLARGYLRRPDATAERFVPNPFAALSGERLYRTGDLARLLPGGAVEFLGRIDHQVKIRGFRIEPGEIEAVLGSHPGVREASVLPREDFGGGRALVAYVVLSGDVDATDIADLRSFLRQRLPDYMVPSFFVPLEALPLTPNGKVDRQALLRIDPERGSGEEAHPSNPTEALLAGVWAEVLGLERVGRDDDFFGLGGHSLLATQVTSRIRELFGIELPLRELFESPTLSGLAERVEKARRESRTPAPPLARVPRQGDLPLSFAQQRLWFLDQLDPGSAAYNVPGAVRLSGRLDAEALRRSFEGVVRRHEALRTVFPAVDGQPFQAIAPAAALRMPVVDLSGLPASRRDAEARRQAGEEAGRPFDLAAGPLLRVMLLELGKEEHLALLTLHHIVSDGWSVGVLFGELAAFYDAFVNGADPALPELPVQYADFAHWQRSWLQGGVLEAELGHWRERLAGAPRTLELPADRPRPTVQTFRGKSRRLGLSPAVSSALAALGRREGATTFMVLLAAFEALLGRHADQDDLVVGSPIAGRNRRETEGLIGFFVNTLALRADLSGDPSFREIVARARRTALDAYLHQDLPFEHLVEALQPERDLSRNPVFQVMFALQNAPRPELRLPGLTLAPVEREASTAKFDLTLTLQEGETGLTGTLEYNADLFDAVTIARFAARLAVLAQAAADAPGSRLSALPLLGESERQQLLEWNSPPACGTGPELCLHELVESQAARTPEAVALVADGAELTYAQLNRRANRLAHHLIDLGVGPEVFVALCARRTPEMVVGLLAILKAGGAYVPLDPDYPAERLALIVDDARPSVLLLQGVPAPAASTHVPRIVDLGSAPAGREDDPVRAMDPENLAYVIYTSGSTGRPKGVAIRHRSAVVLVCWAQETFSAEQCAGVLASTSICFDLSVFELFVPLSRGGAVILADNALALPSLAAAGRVTLINTVPSAMAELARDGGLPASARTVNLAGEALPARLVQDLYRTGTVDGVFNLYGPSEDTTYSTFARIAGDDDRPPAIGRPLANTRVHLLDGGLLAVPPGARGEVFLGGDGLARGYLGRPDLTAERYVPDPFGEPGARLYRTGDLARFRHDGDLEYLGRTDHQVKIRGFRVEPGEVEEALRSHPPVADCAVVVREDAPGDRRLVAFVVSSSPAADLRRFLEERLPAYLVPSAFVEPGSLPLTANGKVDRKALARLDARGPETESVPPRDLFELEVARIWEGLLGREPVGARDDFFELGGHSLLAVRLMARIRERLGRRLPVAALFRGSTVERLARLVRESGDPVRREPLVELQPSGSAQPLFCVHPIGGNVLCYLGLARALGRDQPVYGLQSPDGSPEDLEGMAALYVEALRAVAPEGPYRLAGWSMGGVVAFEMARQLREQGSEVELLALIDAFAPVGPHRPRGLDEPSLAAAFRRDLAGLHGEPDLPEDELRGLFELFRRNRAALAGHTPGRYSGKILFFRAMERLPGETTDDPVSGWRDLGAEMEVEEIPGHHYTLMVGEQAARIAERLRRGEA